MSISLLSFALTGRFPERINLTNKESLSYTRSISQKYDLVVANPPFISIERQEPEVREAVLDSLAELGKGRLDTYLAFLKNSIDILEDGGFGFFVIPQSFLVNDISSGVRKYLSENCQIKMICDLSQIEVFQDVGAYVVLLILQKTGRKRHSTLILQARANVGLALYDMLDGRIVDNSSYTIFEVSETAFGSKKWILEKKTQKVNIGTKVQKVGDTFNVSQGFISGNDSVFIRPLNGLENDSKIWVPYMPDRQITPYSTNYKSEMYFFMPYDQDGKIRSERVLEQRYPDTYRYLVGNKEILTQRSLKGYNKQWWEPTWPRTPDSMLITKIITPQVVFLPKFSYDEQGLYAVSHSPFITLKDNDLDSSILKILLGILNSSFYFSILSASSPKYRGGYSRLSAKVLRELEIPHITSMSVDTIRKVLYYIEMISKEKDLKKKQELEFNIDDVINKLIGI